MSEIAEYFQKQHTITSAKLIPPCNLPQMVVSSLTSGGMPSGENTVKLNFHEGLRRQNLYPHFQNYGDFHFKRQFEVYVL